MTEKETTPGQGGRNHRGKTMSVKDAEPSGQPLRTVYDLADDLELSPVYEPGTLERFTFVCPDCRGAAIAASESVGVTTECLASCGPVDLNDRKRPLTGPLLRRMAYTGQQLDEAAQRPLPWMLEPWLCRGEVTVLAARAGVGKSMLSGELARVVIGGSGFLQWPSTSSGSVAWLDAEQGPQVIGQRLKAQGLLSSVGSSLTIYGTVQGGRSVDVVRDLEAIVYALEMDSPSLVIFDSHRRFTPGRDELDSAAQQVGMEAYEAIARRLNCAVLVIHHSGKAQGSEFRGSTVIEDQSSIAIVLSRPDSDEPTKLRVKWHKTRLGYMPQAVNLSLDGADGSISWSLSGADPHDDIVAAALELCAAEGPRSRNQIAAAVGFTKASTRHRAELAKAVERGVLRLTEDDKIDLPFTAPEVGAVRRSEAEPTTASPAPDPLGSGAGAAVGEQVAPMKSAPGAPVLEKLSGDALAEAVFEVFPSAVEVAGDDRA